MSQKELAALSAEEFQELSQLINNLCGISLSGDKVYLVRQRFSHILKAHSCEGFKDLISLLRNQPSMTLKDQIISAIVTTETSFFRDQKPYDLLLQKIFPRFLEERQLRPINILSAGISTGEEIYSLSILSHEYSQSLTPPVEPVGLFSLPGLDISSQVLEQARAGLFSEIQVSRGLKKIYLSRYFEKEQDGWRVKNQLKRIINLRRYDLTSAIPLGVAGTYDVILCRNVLIYFDQSNKENILKRYHDLLSNRGILLLGSSEVINKPQDLGYEPNNQGGCLYYTKSRKS